MCSFCNAEAESLEHLFLSCPIINPLWANLIVWCNSKNIQIKSLSDVDKMFGIWTRKEDTLILNHLRTNVTNSQTFGDNSSNIDFVHILQLDKT